MVVSESRTISAQGYRYFDEMVKDCYISGFEVVVIAEGSLLLSEEVFHRLALSKISGPGPARRAGSSSNNCPQLQQASIMNVGI